MRSPSLKKFFIGLLIFSQLFLAPGMALAIFGVDGATNPVPINNSGSATQNAPFDIKFQFLLDANETCAKAESAFEKGNALKQSFDWGSVIGGSNKLVGQLAVQLNEYNGFQACRQGIISGLDKLSAPNTYTWSEKQSLYNLANAALQTYKTKAEQTTAKLANAEQGFWKTLTFNILIKLSKSVADALVTKLVSNYKIANLMRYTDSVATLMYDNQFIRQNFPEAQGQFMARAVLENPQFRYKIQPGVFTAADQALGFNPKAFDVNNPNFYANMAAAGSSAANPYYQNTVLVGNLDQARANSLTYAQAHVAQSAGFKTPVNCLGSLSQQRAIDAQTSAVIAKMANRNDLLKNLQQAKDLGQDIKDSDIQQAQADYQAALVEWNNLPSSVGDKSPAITMCEAIVSPATLINQGIDSVFKNFGTQMTQYNDNNLPSFVSLIGNVAAQIGSSFIFGGALSAKNTALINEGRTINAAVGFANQAIYSQIADNLAKGIQFDVPALNPNSPNSYTISWQIISDKLPNASYVTLAGDGISASIVDPQTNQLAPNKLPLNSPQAVTTTKGGNYVLTVYDTGNKVIGVGTITLDIASLNANNGSVAGAYTAAPAIQTRGPEVPLVIR